jgi:hypothetical protein
LHTRFYIDPVTGAPHIYNHEVAEEEAIEVPEKPGTSYELIGKPLAAYRRRRKKKRQ